MKYFAIVSIIFLLPSLLFSMEVERITSVLPPLVEKRLVLSNRFIEQEDPETTILVKRAYVDAQNSGDLCSLHECVPTAQHPEFYAKLFKFAALTDNEFMMELIYYNTPLNKTVLTSVARLACMYNQPNIIAKLRSFGFSPTEQELNSCFAVAPYTAYRVRAELLLLFRERILQMLVTPLSPPNTSNDPMNTAD